jgi:undecaprenyl diphosphate synthase
MNSSLPRHVAIVMDGNGRFAEGQGVPRLEGHRRGAEVALDIVKHVAERGISYLTLFTFSSENWRRPNDEVQGLMTILYEKLLKEADSLVKNGVRLHTIGAIDRLPRHVQEVLVDVAKATQQCTKLNLTLALSYGARDEIVRACQKAMQGAKDGTLSIHDFDEEQFSSLLDTSHMPDPDILIRTSGENRLSNFLLWQSSYTEIFFLKVLWPDFTRNDFDGVLSEFSSRERRFGGISSEKDLPEP